MDEELVYLDTYVLQQDMRIRMPKTILTNLSATRGVTRFAIFLDQKKRELVLRICDEMVEEK